MTEKPRVALAYTTCERTDFTAITLPPIMAEAEGNFDLYWLDGSKTKQGRDFQGEFAYAWRADHGGKYPLKEAHLNVGGGAANAIIAAFTYLLGKDVDYIGLIENDVLLQPGWFDKTMKLFTHAPKVGIASARCFSHRILERRGAYAVMADVGAGMMIARKDLVHDFLINWRTPALWECMALCKHFTGLDYPIPKFVQESDPALEKDWAMTHDWYWPIIAMRRGYATLALTPSLARNLDDPDGLRDPVEA